jgi:hypothetical protein
MAYRSAVGALLAAATLLAFAPGLARAEEKGLTGLWLLTHYERTKAEQGEGIGGILPRANPPLTDKARADINRQDPATRVMNKQRCLPVGVPRMMVNELPIEIVESPERIAIIGEQAELARTIYLNSDDSGAEGEPTWNGVSYGKWVGGELVVQVSGLNDKVAHILGGPAGPNATHIEERYKVVDGGKGLTITFTFTDPKLLTKPYTITYHYDRQPPGAQRWEYICDVDDPQWSTALGYDPVTGKATAPPKK